MNPHEVAPDHRLAALAAREASRLRAAFGLEGAPGPIAGCLPMGDPHRGGRRVTRVRFRSGLVLMYKPRPVAAELVWSRAVRWLGERVGSGPFLVPRIAAGRQHGWVEAVAPHRPRTADQVRGYHRRLGALLALFDVLEVRDVHRDNLVAVGEHPVLVDAETIAHPRLAPFRGAPSLALTGCLPDPGRRDGRAGITAGLPRWSSDPSRWTDDVVAGYRDAYRALRECGGELLARGGPLARLATLDSRAVLRPTAQYRAALRGAPARAAALRWPAPGLPPLPIPRRGRAATIAAERRALARGDVPLFHAPAGGRDLLDAGRVVVPDCFPEPALARIGRRLARLSPIEEREMADLIRGALLLAGRGTVPGRAARGRSGRRARSR